MEQSGPSLPPPQATPPSLPPPTMGAPLAPPTPVAAPSTPVIPSPPAPQPAPMAHPTVPLEPVQSSATPRRGLLIGGVSLVAVAGLAGGAYVLTQGDSGETTGFELSTDANESSSGYSFSAATSNAQQAQAVTFEMTMDSPDGAMTMVATGDRQSERFSIDADLSQLTQDESFIDMGDSMRIIVDQDSATAYMSADFLTMFLDVDAEWISMPDSDISADEGGFDELFTNPLSIAAFFGDVEPTDLGQETIDGETLHRYEVSLDGADIQAHLESNPDDEFSPLLTEGIGKITYTVFVSADDQIRRIVADAPDGDFDMWIEVSETPIEIELPDPSTVMSMEELFGDMILEN